MTHPGPGPPHGSGPVFFQRRVFVVVGAALLVCAAAGIFITLAVERYATFPSPPRSAWNEAARVSNGGEQLWLDADGERVEAWLLPPRNAHGKYPLIISAHGNGELIDMQPGNFSAARAAGAGVLLVEYPGYGRSAGSPSERSVSAAMVAAFDWAVADPRIDARRIVGHGRSLGGGAIAQLAARRPLAALVLESTFTSLAEIIRGYGVPDLLVLNRLDTRAVLKRYHGPVLILHGSRDSSIPVEHAYALHAAAPQSELHVFACGHNDCPPHWELVRSFLASNGVCRNSDQENRHEKITVC